LTASTRDGRRYVSTRIGGSLRTTGAGRACFNIGDRQIADVMTPRLDVHWIDAEDPPSAILAPIRECPHEQLLIGRGSIMRPIGAWSLSRRRLKGAFSASINLALFTLCLEKGFGRTFTSRASNVPSVKTMGERAWTVIKYVLKRMGPFSCSTRNRENQSWSQ